MITLEKPPEFVVTARKWRPLKFSDVVGQEHISQTLSNAIKSNRIHHAYMFCGPRGVGKTTTARILARAVNCLNPDGAEPCNACATCMPAFEGRSMDVIEIDGASNNSVDDIRKLRENSKYPPVAGKYKIYIIDEVHMLSNSAFNALLKTLEEPPPHLMFIFATTESHKVPATIISRCQRFDFRRMEIKDITSQLSFIAERENISIDDESMITIAKKADGSMRDSQSIFDQVVAFCGKDIKYSDMAGALHLIDQDFFFRISNAIINHNAAEMFYISAEVISKGYDLQECLHGLLEHLRNFLTIKVTGKSSMIESSQSYIEKYKEDAAKFTKGDLLRYINLVVQTEQALRFSPQPRIRFELALVQLASLDSAIDIADLLGEIKSIKSLDSPRSAPAIAERQPAQTPIPPKQEPAPTKYYQESAPAPIINKVKEPEKPILQTQPATPERKIGNKVTEEELRAGWDKFFKLNANAEKGLTMLSQFSPKFISNEIILQTNEDFAFNYLSQKRADLSTLLNDFYGAVVNVKFIKTDEVVPVYQPVETQIVEGKTDNIQSQNNLNEENTSLPNISDDRLAGKHPVEREIINLFNPDEIVPDN